MSREIKAPFKYEYEGRGEFGSSRFGITDSNQTRIGLCFLEEDAKEIVRLMNVGSAALPRLRTLSADGMQRCIENFSGLEAFFDRL